MDNVLVTGGAGYVGSRLVPMLLAANYKVRVYDTCWFGNYLPHHSNLDVVVGDVRDVNRYRLAVAGNEAVVHLACISNDSSFALDEKLSTSINYIAFEPLVLASKAAGVKRFIYASSSSVYGVSEEKDVKEDHPLVPLTLYNKFKGLCEPNLLRHTDKDFVGVIFRPATVCGYSPRQRLDLSVNILTNHAVNKGVITVFGGKQMRPNLHIEDYCRAVLTLLQVDARLVANQIFNVGAENLSLSDLAEVVAGVATERGFVKPEIAHKPSSDDQRSYHINSDKIAAMVGFSPKKSVKDAVNDLVSAFVLNKLPNPEDENYYNVRRLKALAVA